MKRILLIITLLLAVAANAQNKLETVFDNIIGGIPFHSYFTGGDNQRYVLFSSRFTEKDALLTIPNNGEKGTQTSFQHPMEYELLLAYETDNDINCIYKCYHFDTKTYGIYLNIVPKNSEKSEWNPENIVTFPLEKNDDIRCFSARSPDNRKAVVTLFMTNYKSNSLKGSLVLAFDENGLRWNSPLDLEFENNTLQIFGIAINNDIKVYTSILSYTKEEDKSKERKNEILHLYESSEYGEINSAECQVEFGSLSNGRMLVTRKGDVMVAGYYSPKPEKNETGCYIIRYDLASMSCSNISHADFHDSYYTYVHPTTGKKAKDFYVYPMEFFEFQNGTVALLGDMQAAGNMNTAVSIAGNILVHFADSQGEISEMKTIGKSQTSVEKSNHPKQLCNRLFSYYALMHNNKIHILFPDNIRNYQGESGLASFTDTHFFTSDLNYKGLCAAHCTIDPSGNITSPELLMDYTALKTYMFVPFYIENDGAVFLHSGKKSRQISKYKHNFE